MPTIRGGDVTLEGALSGLTKWATIAINFKTGREDRNAAKDLYPNRVVDMHDVTVEVTGLMSDEGGTPPAEGEIIESIDFSVDTGEELPADLTTLGDPKWKTWKVFDVSYDIDRTKADWSFTIEPGHQPAAT